MVPLTWRLVAPMLPMMAQLPPSPPAQPPDDCASQRTEARTLCEESERAQETYGQAAEHAREARRDIVAARRLHDAAMIAADPVRRREEKSRAREVYESARAIATTDSERTEATATWARAIDRANRSGRLAQRTLAKTRVQRATAEDVGREESTAEQASRMGAEAAEAACLEARVRLAACEEQIGERARQTAPEASQPATKHSSLHGVTFGQPLVIEALLGDDRKALELVAAQVTNHAALTQAQALLYVQELVHAIVSAAAQRGYLLFEASHPLWSHLSVAEAGDVVAALARLGFQFEPSEGWHAGRAPVSRDLTMALAYAGLDARGMRVLPSDSELRELPRSIGVDARAFLAAELPDLNLDNIVRVLEHRAQTLTPLWDAWGQIRPILLSERQALDSPPAN